MPSAANAKSEKPASSEASDNSPVRQIMTILDHKIRNLEKRKSKLTSYRDLQKSGKELNSDQKVAVAKYDEVAQTLEFARELSKQVTGIATSAEREAKKQAKREAWIRYAADTNKIREVLLILDCLNQMGSSEARDDFLTGSNGAAKLTEEDLKILDDLYPEVTPKHEPNEEGQPGFHAHTIKAAEHLYAIIDGKPKEVLGTTYTHIKEVVNAVHECGYFDKTGDSDVAESEEVGVSQEEEQSQSQTSEEPPASEPAAYAPPPAMPAAPTPAPAPLPAPAYPLRPPITLQEVEQAYFSQQYPQQRPISEVIGSQNFFFLQESEIDSPIGTPQPPPMMAQPSPPGPIPTQTFTNQHFVRVPDPAGMPLPPPPHFPPHPEHAFAGVPLPAPLPHPHAPHVAPPPLQPPQPPLADRQPTPPQPQLQSQPEEQKVPTPVAESNDDEWKESRSPEREDTGERKTQGQGDGQNRYRRYGGRGGGGGRGASNGYRGGRGAFQSRQGGDYHGGRHGAEYQSRSDKDSYRTKQYNDGYQSRHGKDGYDNRRGNDTYYGNGDAVEGHQNQNGGRERERYGDGAQGYAGGFKSRGRGGPRPAPRGAPRARPHQYSRKPDNTE